MQVRSLREAAEKLGIGLTTLKRLIAAGKIRKIRITDGRVGITDAEIEGFIATRVAEAEAA